jgi:AcrR family transcriptional regulator
MSPVPKTSPEAILQVAAELAAAEGLKGVGVRAIAAKLKISPGTLYNVVGDIDDILLRVNEQTLIEVRNTLREAVAPERDVLSNVLAVAEAYIDFVHQHPKRWSMLIEYSIGTDKLLPAWYRETLDQAVGTVEQLLRPLIASRKDRHRAVAILWATLQGVSTLTASGKLTLVDDDDPHALVELLVSRFLGTYQAAERSGGARATLDFRRHKALPPRARRKQSKDSSH